MVPEVRPRGIGEILDIGVAIYRERFWTLIKLTMLFVVPLGVINALVLISAAPDDYEVTAFGTQPVYEEEENSDLIPIAAFALTYTISTLTTAFVVAGATRPSAGAYTDDGNRGPSMLRSAPWGKVLGLSLVLTVATIIPYLFCVLPGWVLLGLWSISIPILILENSTVGKALGRSWRMTGGHFWHSVGLYVSAQALAFTLSIGLSALVGALIVTDSSPTTLALAQSIASTTSAVFTTPIIATVVIALYFDLRIRTEAFDVQMMLTRIDNRRYPQTDALEP